MGGQYSTPIGHFKPGYAFSCNRRFWEKFFFSGDFPLYRLLFAHVEQLPGSVLGKIRGGGPMIPSDSVFFSGALSLRDPCEVCKVPFGSVLCTVCRYDEGNGFQREPVFPDYPDSYSARHPAQIGDVSPEEDMPF